MGIRDFSAGSILTRIERVRDETAVVFFKSLFFKTIFVEKFKNVVLLRIHKKKLKNITISFQYIFHIL